VAERGSDPGQSRPLIDIVVSLGQGNALARPATAERVEAYLEEFPAHSR
jgi:hypothetical protein